MTNKTHPCRISAEIRAALAGDGCSAEELICVTLMLMRILLVFRKGEGTIERCQWEKSVSYFGC